VSEAETHYAQTPDGTYVAYQLTGEGPLDVLVIMGHGISVEDQWEEPRLARFLQRLGSFARVIRFDRRGTGCSDRGIPIDENTWERWLEDASTVLDAVGVDNVAVVTLDMTASPISFMLTATSPRVKRLVLFDPAAKFLAAPPEYPMGLTDEDLDAIVAATVNE
jgi:pimeloyl-ACP methyl ester carboxylesterase